MPETKKVQFAADTGDTLFAILIWEDGLFFDQSDGTFKAAPAGTNAAGTMTEKTIGATAIQVYEFSNAVTEWKDGFCYFYIYKKLGANPAFATDSMLGAGTIKVYRDRIVERSYSYSLGG